MARRRVRSWMDIVIAWIDRLPGPAWAAYAALVVLSLAAAIVPRLLDGSRLDTLTVLFAALTFTPFAIMHAVNSASREALADFRPALGDLEPQYDDLERRLVTTSFSTGIVGALLGLTVIIVGVTTVEGGWGIAADNSAVTNVITFVEEVILNAGLFTFLLHQMGHVRTIARIHRDSTNVVLWNVRPHNAFARVTVLAAIAIAVLYVTAGIGSALSTQNSFVAIGLAIVAAIFATVLFAGPLTGMRRRLVREKEHQLSETDRVSEDVASRLRANLDAGDLAAAAALQGLIGGLASERERLRKVSTWPWSADTLRAFLTSLGVPIALWFLTTLLGRVLFT